jgi:hypothetical protein
MTRASWSGFRRWRRARPFWGGLLLLIAGLELFFSANLTLGDLQVHFGPEGFLSYLLPVVLVLCGVLSWITPGQRLFYGILGLLTAVYSLIGLNLGGFFAGMLIGIIGGALLLAWAPDPHRPREASAPAPSPPQDAPEPTDPPEWPGPDDHRTAAGPPPLPRRDPRPDPHRPPPGDAYRKALAVTLVPLTITAAVLIAGAHTPARAETECPEGLPSRPAAAKKEPARRSKSEPAPTRPPARKPAKTSVKPSAGASATPTPAATGDKTGNPIVDGWNGFVEGVGDLLGIGDEDDATPSPSASQSPGPPPGPPAGGTPEPTASASGPPGKPDSPAPSSAVPSPTPSLPDIPCLGARVFKTADPDDVPTVSIEGGTLETRSLTMYDSTYDGVIQLRTAHGTISALKFSMTKAVNKPFKLTVPEAGGRTTLIESKELSTEGNVRFYTPSFKGKLFGLFPVTFTPEQPPPLTTPVLWFTDVEINLAFVRCDTLKGVPLDLSEKA